MGKIVGDGAVHLFQVQELEILTDGFRRLTSTKCVNDRIQRDPRPCNVKVAVAILNVFFGHVKIVPLLTIRPLHIKPLLFRRADRFFICNFFAFRGEVTKITLKSCALKADGWKRAAAESFTFGCGFGRASKTIPYSFDFGG